MFKSTRSSLSRSSNFSSESLSTFIQLPTLTGRQLRLIISRTKTWDSTDTLMKDNWAMKEKQYHFPPGCIWQENKCHVNLSASILFPTLSGSSFHGCNTAAWWWWIMTVMDYSSLERMTDDVLVRSKLRSGDLRRNALHPDVESCVYRTVTQTERERSWPV